MRIAPSLFMVLLALLGPALPTTAQEAPDTAEQKFLERAAKVKTAAADKHVELAKLFRKNGANLWAKAELDQALALAPEHEKAMKELGFKRKRVDGADQWVLEDGKSIPATDAAGLDAKAREALQAEQTKTHKAIAQEFVKLAGVAGKSSLTVHARVCCEIAVRYDPSNEDALKGAGWVKEDGAWISPAETAERAETAQALADVPTGESIENLPAWCATVFGEGKGIGLKFGKLSVFGSGNEHANLGRYAHATFTLSAALLGEREGELRLVLAATKAEYERYCDARHPGIEGLKNDSFVIGEREVAIQLSADGELNRERAVYTTALHECRRRCGEPDHPWFERGLAGNLTRRLTGRVSTAEHAGEKSGPAEAGRWKRSLRMLIGAGEAPALGKLVVARDPDEKQLMLAYFMTRYLCTQRKAALAGYCAALLAGEGAEAALLHGFEQDSGTLEAAFLAWFERN